MEDFVQHGFMLGLVPRPHEALFISNSVLFYQFHNYSSQFSSFRSIMYLGCPKTHPIYFLSSMATLYQIHYKSLSIKKYGSKKNNWKKYAVNLSIAPCSENRSNHDSIKSLISLVLYGFKSPNWQLDAV